MKRREVGEKKYELWGLWGNKSLMCSVIVE
jgi:hypothetical protein